MSMRNNLISLNITSRFNISDCPSSTNIDYNLHYTFFSWLVKWTHEPMMVGGQWAIVVNLLTIVSTHSKASISYGGSFRKPSWSNNILTKENFFHTTMAKDSSQKWHRGRSCSNVNDLIFFSSCYGDLGPFFPKQTFCTFSTFRFFLAKRKNTDWKWKYIDDKQKDKNSIKILLKVEP